MSAQNQAQIELWDGRVGEKWAAMQVALDEMLAPAATELLRRAGSVNGLRVLDVGCGCGGTSIALATDGALLTAVDVSAPMLAVAKQRVAGLVNAPHFIQADASLWRGEHSFDLIVSQFGLMFFDDVTAAFANLAGNLRSCGRLLFTCWRSVEENEWVTLPMAAVRPLLPAASHATPTQAVANAPGPFALADEMRLRGLLEGAGFQAVVLTAVDFRVCFASRGGVETATRFAMQIGPAAAALAEVDKPTKIVAAERIRTALQPHEAGGRVALGGAIWLVEATLA